MQRKTIEDIQKKKNFQKITCLTAYTASVAKVVDKHVDMILIGDSLGTAIYGMANTQSVTLDMMIAHGKAVINYSKKAYTIIDMPYNTYNNNKEALFNAKKLLNNTNCQSVKLETDSSHIKTVNYLVKNNIQVVAHIGVTPQKYKNFNKIKSVGTNPSQAKKTLKLAHQLEQAGSSMIVLECMKESLAKEISKKIKIPTIGIGASKHCDGQVLVINDILNTSNLTKKPRFIKSYTNIAKIIEKAVKQFSNEVTNNKFPKKNNTY